MWWWSKRINRATYWPALCVATAAYLAIVILQVKGGFSEIILVALAVPRLHDIGKSGWWAGGALLIEIAIVAISFMTLPISAVAIPSGIFVVVVFGVLIWLGTIPGQPNANKYGEPPEPGFWSRRQPTTTPD